MLEYMVIILQLVNVVFSKKTFALLESDLQCHFLNMYAFNIFNIECSGMAKVSLNLWLVDYIIPEMQLICIAITLR